MHSVNALKSGQVDVNTYSVPSLNRASPVPLYEQVRRCLITMVLNWPADNERFHTDQELSDMFAVSRMTVRQAVQELVVEGLLRRERGSGTFVCVPKVDEHVSLQSSYVDQWADFGENLEYEVLRCTCEASSAQISQQLEIDQGDLIWNLVRRRKVRNIPISVDYRYIPKSIVKSIKAEQVSKISLLELLSKHVELGYGNLTLEAASVGIEYADILGLLPGDPVLNRTLRYYDNNDRVVMSGVSFYRAGQVRYSLQVPLMEESKVDDESKDGLKIKAL